VFDKLLLLYFTKLALISFTHSIQPTNLSRASQYNCLNFSQLTWLCLFIHWMFWGLWKGGKAWRIKRYWFWMPNFVPKIRRSYVEQTFISYLVFTISFFLSQFNPFCFLFVLTFMSWQLNLRAELLITCFLYFVLNCLLFLLIFS